RDNWKDVVGVRRAQRSPVAKPRWPQSKKHMTPMPPPAPVFLAEAFIQRALKIARRGVAMLTRTVFIESAGRHERLFKPNPPAVLVSHVHHVSHRTGRRRSADSAEVQARSRTERSCYSTASPHDQLGRQRTGL